MNYTKYIKKKNRIINSISETFTKNIYLSNNFDLKINFSEIYKDDVLSIYLTNIEYKLILYVYIDLIKLDIQKTKFEYFIYKNNSIKSEFLVKGTKNYENLNGKDLNQSISNLIEEIISTCN